MDCPTNNVKRKCAFLPLDFNKEKLYDSAKSTLETDNNIVTCRELGCDGIKTIDYKLKDNIIVLEQRYDKKNY